MIRLWKGETISLSRRPMRVLSPIVQISALSVHNAGKQLTPSDTIASQLVGHDHPWDVLQPLQKLPEEAFCGVGITPGLNEDVEHNTILIDGVPEVMLRALNPDEDFVHVPLVPGRGRGRRTRSAKRAPNLPHRLVCDDNAAFSQEHSTSRRLRLNT
jgi:hypothetical protein